MGFYILGMTHEALLAFIRSEPPYELTGGELRSNNRSSSRGFEMLQDLERQGLVTSYLDGDDWVFTAISKDDLSQENRHE